MGTLHTLMVRSYLIILPYVSRPFKKEVKKGMSHVTKCEDMM
jgi:hypothetical protein